MSRRVSGSAAARSSHRGVYPTASGCGLFGRQGGSRSARDQIVTERGGGVLQFTGVAFDAALLGVFAAVFVGGFLRGFVGFGAALVIVPVLSLTVGPHMAVAVSSIIGLPAVMQLLPEAIRWADRAVVLPVASAIVLAAPVGSWVLVTVDPGLMKIVISLLVIGMVVMLAFGQTLRGPINFPGMVAAGAVGGFLQGSAGMGGPPVVAVALALPEEPRKQRGNVLALMSVVAASSVPALTWHGLFTVKAVSFGVVLLPVFLLATALGSRYFAQGGSRYYRNAALATLGAVGVGALVASIERYFSA
jgi:uncharacterized protein